MNGAYTSPGGGRVKPFIHVSIFVDGNALKIVQALSMGSAEEKKTEVTAGNARKKRSILGENWTAPGSTYGGVSQEKLKTDGIVGISGKSRVTVSLPCLNSSATAA